MHGPGGQYPHMAHPYGARQYFLVDALLHVFGYLRRLPARPVDRWLCLRGKSRNRCSLATKLARVELLAMELSATSLLQMLVPCFVRCVRTAERLQARGGAFQTLALGIASFTCSCTKAGVRTCPFDM